MAKKPTFNYKKSDNSIRHKYKPSSEEEAIIRHIYDRYYAMKWSPYRLMMEKEWEAGERAWEAYRRELAEDEWQSNYFIPLTTGVVESVLAEVVEQKQRPFYLPLSPEDAPKAMVMNHIFDYSWQAGDGDSELHSIFKGSLIHGSAIAQEYYLQDKRMVHDIVGLDLYDKNGKIKTKEKEIYEYDDCIMEYVSIWDMFFDENAREVNRGPYKSRDSIRRYIMNYEDFQRFFQGPIWDPQKNAQYVTPGGDTSYYEFFKPPQGFDASKQVEVLWYWSRSPHDMMAVVANDVLVRYGPNIFRHKWLPFAKATDVKRINKFYGKGEPKLLESVQEELNTLRRMTIDRHHLDLDKSFLVPQTSMLDDTDLIARPHNFIPVDDPSNIKALEYGDVPISVQTTTKSINEDSIRVTGVDDRFQSLQKAPSTATEAAILKESTQKRIKMKITGLQQDFLTDIARMRAANIIQFYSQPRLEEIVGEAKTSEYKKKVSQLTAMGQLAIVDGKPMKKSFRKIRIDGKRIDYDQDGRVFEKEIPSFSFFEVTPETFTPVASGGFDIKFEAGANLPVSKPLLQSKTLELYDRLIQLTQLTNYDAERLADKLVEVYDFNPNDFKKAESLVEEETAQFSQEQIINLASKENQEVLSGQPIPQFGTPYATPQHSLIHIAFLKSQAMIDAPQNVYDALVKHITGEIYAASQRGGAMMGQPGQEQPTVPQGAAMGNEMSQMSPDMIQGGDQVQTGLPLGPAR